MSVISWSLTIFCPGTAVSSEKKVREKSDPVAYLALAQETLAISCALPDSGRFVVISWFVVKENGG